MNALAIHGAALLLYIAASVLYGAGLALKTQNTIKLARAAILSGVLIHTLAIGAYCIQTHQSPFAGAFGTLSACAWVVVLVYLPLEFLAKFTALGALGAPLASLLLFAGILRSTGKVAESAEVRTAIINSHVLIVLVSFAFFLLAACCAVFYLWQYSSLKHPDRKATFRKLPPLEKVDSLAYHLVSFALPLLTIGLALGIIRAIAAARHNWISDPHTLLSLAVWAVYAAYLAARLAGGWRGTRLNYLLVAGLIVTLAIFFVPSGTHGFS